MIPEFKLENGIHLNLFLVELPPTPVKVMMDKRSKYMDLRPIRKELEGTKARVYAFDDVVYGYGKDSQKILGDKGFTETEVILQDEPHLASNLILEGFLDNLEEHHYAIECKKGTYEAFDPIVVGSAAEGEVVVFRGFDIKSLFLCNHAFEEGKLEFGLIIDATCAFRDKDNRSLSTYAIRQRFGSQALADVRRIQGDLIPTGINTEASRQRLVEHILPFVRSFPKFKLPCDAEVSLINEPTRIVLGGDEI